MSFRDYFGNYLTSDNFVVFGVGRAGQRFDVVDQGTTWGKPYVRGKSNFEGRFVTLSEPDDNRKWGNKFPSMRAVIEDRRGGIYQLW